MRPEVPTRFSPFGPNALLADFPTTARRAAALLAAVAVVGCDSTRTLEPTAAPTVSSEATAAFSATGVGSSSPSVISVSLANPSFESGYTGWSFPGGPGSFVDIGPLWQASHGNNSVDLNGFFPGFVSQNIPTIPGVQYTVQFDLAGNPGSPQGVKTMEVSAGAVTANYSFNTQGRSGGNMGWTAQTFTFTATATTTSLKFMSTYNGNGTHPDRAQGPALDNVRVTWVPTSTTTTVSFGAGPFVYTGSAFTATASVSPAAAGTPTITYSGDCTNAGGTCVATATTAANGQYAASTATADITIEQAPTTTTVSFGSGPFVYNGSAFTATASVSPAAAGAATIAYSGDCTNAGSTCTATATFAASGNYAGSAESASITIDKAATTTTAATFGAASVVYTGSAFTATASVSPAAAGSATISYSGDCTNAGNSCTATASYPGNGNYLPSSSPSTGLTIDKAPTATSVTFGTGPTVYYTGSAFTATASVSPAAAGAAAIAYSGQCTLAGTCTATATFAGNSNYLPSSASTSITIKYPVATSGDKCKNGGWQYLTDDLGNLFKNQGDCVSYVATKGKNKGAGGD